MLLLVIYLCNIGNTRKLVFFVSPTFYSISSFPKVKDEGGLPSLPHHTFCQLRFYLHTGRLLMFAFYPAVRVKNSVLFLC